MQLNRIRQVPIALAIAAVLAFAAACSAPGTSLSPTSPSGVAASASSSSAVSGATGFPTEPPCDPSKETCEPPPPDPCQVDPSSCEPPPPPDPCKVDPASCEPPPPPPPGDEGCTPGYWKGNAKKGAGEWPPYAPGQTVGSVGFVAGSFNGLTLLQALELGGGPGVPGATQNLLRAAVAALLNAGNANVDYPLTTAQIVAQVNAAIASNDRSTILNLATRLDGFNNGGCPIDNSGRIL